MRITEAADLPGSPEKVFGLRATPEFQDEKCARTGPAEHSVSVVERAGRTVITTNREMNTDELPEAVRAVVGARLSIHEVQDWGPAQADGSRSARIAIQIHGAPLTLRGTLTLTPTPTGSHQSLVADLKASIPLLGGKVERAAAPAISHGFDLEADIITEWLA